MTRKAALRPLGAGTALVVVDMQRLFAEATAWQVATFSDILPRLCQLAERYAGHALFTRFLTPATPAAASGTWKRYYRHWATVTLDRMPPSMLDLVAPLAAIARPDAVCDKTTYSAFDSAGFRDALSRRKADSLVLTGIETDVCVLATALDAVDRGLRVVVVADAVTSGSLAGHAAALDAVLPRFDQQIELASADELLAAWQAA